MFLLADCTCNRVNNETSNSNVSVDLYDSGNSMPEALIAAFGFFL